MYCETPSSKALHHSGVVLEMARENLEINTRGAEAVAFEVPDSPETHSFSDTSLYRVAKKFGFL